METLPPKSQNSGTLFPFEFPDPGNTTVMLKDSASMLEIHNAEDLSPRTDVVFNVDPAGCTAVQSATYGRSHFGHSF